MKSREEGGEENRQELYRCYVKVEAELVKSREEGGQGEESRQELYRCYGKVEAELVKSREEGG